METFRPVAPEVEIRFKKNPDRKRVKRALFIPEGEDKFEKLSLRNKMTQKYQEVIFSYKIDIMIWVQKINFRVHGMTLKKR